MGRYGARKLVYVTPYATAPIKYGFSTSIKEASQTALGQTGIETGALPAGLVFGANAPKPGRASKTLTTGSESSFYDISKAQELRADAWRLTFPTIRRGRKTRKSTCLVVTIGVVEYAWLQNDETYAKIGADLAGLGIEVGTIDNPDLVWGARFPKPPRAQKVFADNSTVSTFIDPSKLDALPPGWSPSKEIVTGVAAADG